MAYGLNYIYESTSFYGKSFRLEIFRKDFVGTPTTIINGASPNPIELRYEGTNADNPYYPIWGSSLTFSFFEQNGISLEDIATDFERDVRLDLYVNDAIYWKGWVVPDLCNDSAYRNDTVINIVATDGLVSLSKIPILQSEEDKVVLSETIGSDLSSWNWAKSGLRSPEVQYNTNATLTTILNVLKVCIDKTELSLGVQVINDLYPVDLPTKDQRQFENISIDVLCYQKDGESKTCEDVLKSILSSCGCVIFQRNGFWFIERINYLEGVRVQSEIYDKDFKFLQKRTENIRQYLKGYEGTWKFLTDNFIRRLRPPYQFQTIEYPYFEPLDICPDSLLWRSDIGIDVTGWVANGLTATKGYNPQNGESTIVIADNNTGSQTTGFYSPKIDVRRLQSIKIEFDVLADTSLLFVKLEGVKTSGRGTGVGTTYYWNHKENTWRYNTQPDGDIVLQLNGNRIPFIGQNGGQSDYISEYTSQEITLPPCIESGKITVILKGGTSKYITSRGNVGVGNTVGYKNFKVNSGITKELHSFDLPKTVSYEADSLTVLNGDSLMGLTDRTTLLYQSDFTTSSRTGTTVKKVYKGTSKWRDSSEQEPDTLLGFTARSILNNFSTRHNIVEGTIKTEKNIKIGTLLSFDSFKKFQYQRLLLCPPFTYNVFEDSYQCTLFQLSCDISKGRLSQYWLDDSSNPIYKNVFDYTGSTCKMSFIGNSICVNDNSIFSGKSICV